MLYKEQGEIIEKRIEWAKGKRIEQGASRDYWNGYVVGLMEIDTELSKG